MLDPVMRFGEVTKRFGGFTAVDRLSFAVPKGGVFRAGALIQLR